MSIFPKSLHRFNKLSVTILTGLLIKLGKMTLKYKCRNKGLRIAKTILENLMIDFAHQLLKPINNQDDAVLL